MAYSKCPHCNNTFFELKEVSPSKSNFKLHFVQCSSCGSPFGVIDYMNIGSMLTKQNKALKKIAKAVGVSVDL